MTSPGPLNRSNLTRAGIIGAVLAVVGIGLFFALWIGLGQAGTSVAPRLFASICVPPLLLGVLVGGYALVRRARGS